MNVRISQKCLPPDQAAASLLRRKRWLAHCGWRRFGLVVAAMISFASMVAPSAAFGVDLSQAVVVHPKEMSKPEQNAVTMLIEEVEKRAQIRWPTATTWPTNNQPVIVLGTAAHWSTVAGPYASEPALDAAANLTDGFQVRVRSSNSTLAVIITGHDSRGILYGAGHLLRQLRLRPGSAGLPDRCEIATAPKYPLRGHQLGYRPKTHSYDAWNLAIWEQYYRDLIVFGANAVELIPPRSDDDPNSPHFPMPPMEMMKGMSSLADDYGLDVWIWYPAMDRDYSDPRTVETALKEWRVVFEQLPRIDAVFVPGGDPGHTPPRLLMSLLAKQAKSLREVHPRAQMWVSPQSFDQQWLDEFIGMLQQENPEWLSGVVFGPQVRISLPKLRALVPARYPIRHYPDITHTRQCQYPVPDWDVAFAITEGRECINPRPVDEAAIFRLLQPHTIGFLTYSEGCNDDVNKAVWSALGWDPERPIIDVLREYSRYFVGENFTEGFAQGLLALEQNWRGPVSANSNIETTLEQFQTMEREATPAQRLNWRFQAALFRAYYDAYTRSRQRFETMLEDQAMEQLRAAPRLGSRFAVDRAESTLARALAERVCPDWRERIGELAEAMYQSIRVQSSVSKYQAIAVDRGASLDTVDYPLNNRSWLRERFTEIRALSSETKRLEAIQAIVSWTNPGPGGFYDDLGNTTRQPHLVRGLGFSEDPASLASAKTGFEEGDVVDEPDEKPEGALRYSWLDHAESLNDQPLVLRYQNLETGSRYRLRIVYGGDSPKRTIRLVAGNNLEIHPLRAKEFPYRPVEFEIPAEAIRDGELTLTWTREPGLGGNGRGCQVAEVWLMRQNPRPESSARAR
jgi:hypothetical protein